MPVKKRRNGAPPVPSASYVRKATMFKAADVERLAGIAGHRMLASASTEAIAKRIDHAISMAVHWETGERRMSPPSRRRDYLDKVAKSTAALIATLDIATLGPDHHVPDEITLHLSPGFRHLTDVIERMRDPHRDAFTATWIARMVTPDFKNEEDELGQAIDEAAKITHVDPIDAMNRAVRRRLELALERGLLALPLLLRIASQGRDLWDGETAPRGDRKDMFRHDLMRSLAMIYRDCFGFLPDVTDGQREPNGPAAHWVCEVVRIAAERAHLAPQAADTDDMPAENAGAMIRKLSTTNDATLARYLAAASAALAAAESKAQAQDSPA